MDLSIKQSIIPRHKRTIPIPAREQGRYGIPGETHTGMPYDEACALLEKLGFQCLSRTQGLRHSSFQYLRPENITEKSAFFSLWQHPAGVFVTADSYGACEAERDQPPTENPPPKLNSLNIYTQFNSGCGRANYRAASRLQGSGGCTPLPDGTTVWNRSFRTGNHGDSGLLDDLDRLQKVARFTPFSQWKENTHIHIDLAHCLGIAPNAEDAGLKPTELHAKYAHQIATGIKALLDRCPEDLRPLVESAFLPMTAGPKREDGLHNELWRRTEYTIDQFRDLLAATGKNWPTPSQAQLFERWVDVIDHPQRPIDLISDRASDIGPGNSSLAIALLGNTGRAGNTERLFDLLERIDEPTLYRWATVPDSLGHTLPSRLLLMAGDRDHQAGSMLLSSAPQMEAVTSTLDILVRRLGAESVSLYGKASPIGTMHDLLIDPDTAVINRGGSPLLAARMLEVISHADSLGLSWANPSNPVEVAAFRGLTETGHEWPALQKLSALWSRLDLEHTAAPARGSRFGARL